MEFHRQKTTVGNSSYITPQLIHSPALLPRVVSFVSKFPLLSWIQDGAHSTKVNYFLIIHLYCNLK